MKIKISQIMSALVALALIVLALSWPQTVRAEFLPAAADTLCPTEWLSVGPFSVGAREGIAGVIDKPENLRPREGDQLPSILPQGGRVSWKKVAPDSTGWVTLEYQDVWWDTLMTYYGVAGIVDAGYAYTEFESQGQTRALALAQRVGSFYLNGKRFSGDVYGHGYVKTPVLLQDGLNRVLVKLSGYGDHRFLFRLIPPATPVMLITEDATLPDLIRGQNQSLWVGITLLNTTEIRLKDVKLSLGGDGGFEKTETVIASIMPLCVKKVPIRLELSEAPDDVDTVSVPVEVSWKGSSVRDRLVLRVRNPEQSRKITFISAIDNSCQYYALLPPKDYDPEKRYGLILALHGAGVEASRLVDCHAPKDWAFVVAPTNRRTYGFDWQDWGRLDALEVLNLVKEAFPIDTNRVCLTGHSMGGHGVWHIALAHSDLFAAAAPMAGWTCFQLYVPWFLQKSYSFAEPRQIAIRDMSLREDFVPEFVENALNLPIFITQGGSDDNVPPVHARMFASLLEQLGYQYEYNEIPGKGHWYNLDDSSHTVCVDDPRVMDFLKDKTRNPFPKHVIFKTSDIGQNNKAYWVEITQQEKPYFESRIRVEVKTGRIDVQTTNVREFALSLSEDLLPYGKISLNVNGRETAFKFQKEQTVFFRRKGDEFVVGKPKHSPLTKEPSSYGPIKQAYFSPFVLVYGTKGDSLAIETTLHQARLEAARWWSRANGSVDILLDSEVTERIMENYNLILFGGPEENFITGRLNQHLPLRVENGRMLLGEKEIPGDNLAAEFIYPNPLHPDRFVFIHQGTGAVGMELSNFFTTLYAGAGLPDFVIFDRQVKRKGWGGVVCAGFFDLRWQIDDKLYYLKD